MSKNNSNFIIRFSLIRVIGVFLFVSGLFCICFFGAESMNKQNQISETRTDEEYTQQNYNKIYEKNSGKIFMVIMGGFIVISAVPFFYVPYEQHCITIKFKRHKNKTDEEILIDSEFDYPDDDFDYILDKNMRQILIELKEENIRKKNKLR